MPTNLWQPGVSGNPAGRLRGSRNALSEEVICALLRDFRQHGQKAVARVRRTQPAAYLKILALLVPREHKVEHPRAVKDMTDEQLEAGIEAIQRMLEARAAGDRAKVIEGTAEQSHCRRLTRDKPKRPNKVMDGSILRSGRRSASRGSACRRLLTPDLTMSGRKCGRPRSASRAKCHRLQAPNITMSGRDTRRVGSADRQDLVTCWIVRYAESLMPPDINHWDATGLVNTVQKKCIIFPVSLNGAGFPMRNQRRNASPPNTVNCTVRKYLTAREIEKLMDYARKHSRYGHRELDHDPGHLSSWTASLGGLRSPMASGRARPGPHARPQGQERHAIRPSDPGR